jgi:hypothetical protein
MRGGCIYEADNKAGTIRGGFLQPISASASGLVTGSVVIKTR